MTRAILLLSVLRTLGEQRVPADDRAVAFEEEVLGEVADAFLGDDDVGVALEDVVAELGDFVHLLLEGVGHVGVFGHLHVGLRLAFLVLERTVKQQDSGVSDLSAHLGVGDVFVQHDAVEHLALVEHASGDLLDLGVALDLEVELGGSFDAFHDGAAGLEGEVDDERAPAGGELGADAGAESFLDVFVVVDVDGLGDLVDDLHGVFEGLVVGADDDGRVDFVFDEGAGRLHHLACEADDRGGSVADLEFSGSYLFVLSAGELDHGLGRGVLDVDLSEDGVAVVGHHDASHGVQQHLEHRAGAERGGDDVCDRLVNSDYLRCCDVRSLRFAALLSARVGVHHEDGRDVLRDHLAELFFRRRG